MDISEALDQSILPLPGQNVGWSQSIGKWLLIVMVISCEVGIKGEQIDMVASQLVYYTLKLPTLFNRGQSY